MQLLLFGIQVLQHKRLMFSHPEHTDLCCSSSRKVLTLTAVLVLCLGACPQPPQPQAMPFSPGPTACAASQRRAFTKAGLKEKEGLETSFFHKILCKLFCINFVRGEGFLCHTEAALLNFRLF